MLAFTVEFILFTSVVVALIGRFSPLGRDRGFFFNTLISVTGCIAGVLVEQVLYHGSHGALALFAACLLGGIAAEAIDHAIFHAIVVRKKARPNL